MTTFAFLPEVAAAAVALVAARVGDRLRLPFIDRKDCAKERQSAVVWSYETNSGGENLWVPVTRTGTC